jgi:hypothetical protein
MIMLCMRMATAYHRRITIPEVVAGKGGGRKTQPVLFQFAAAASFQPSSTADCQVTRWRLMHRYDAAFESVFAEGAAAVHHSPHKRALVLRLDEDARSASEERRRICGKGESVHSQCL